MFSIIRWRLAELNFAQNKITDATQALQSLANTASTPDKKLAAQLKLAEMYVSKANIADCGAVNFGDYREGSPQCRRIATSRGDQHRQGPDR